MEILKLAVTRPRTAIAVMKFAARGLAPAMAAAERGDMETAMRLFGTAILGREFYRKLSQSRQEQVRANAIKAEFLGSGFAPLDEEEIRGLQVPTLLITSQCSASLFRRLTDRLEELLPNTERVEIPRASHILHEDNPPAYNAAVLSFLTKHRGEGLTPSHTAAAEAAARRH